MIIDKPIRDVAEQLIELFDDDEFPDDAVFGRETAAYALAESLQTTLETFDLNDLNYPAIRGRMPDEDKSDSWMYKG